jgi:hypothetical protein
MIEPGQDSLVSRQPLVRLDRAPRSIDQVLESTDDFSLGPSIFGCGCEKRVYRLDLPAFLG